MINVEVIGGNAQLLNAMCKDNIHFVDFFKVQKEDIVLFLDNEKEKVHFNKCSRLLLNSDVKNLKLSTNEDIYTITFGVNSQATITISSIKETENIVMCLQRKIEDIFGRVIEPQEFVLNYHGNNIHEILGVASVFLIIGKINVLKYLLQ